MTTGTYVLQGIPTSTTDNGSSARVGRIFSRTWSGEDAPSCFARKTLWRPAYDETIAYIDRKGRERYRTRHVPRKRVSKRVRVAPFREPKPYTLTVMHEERSVHQYWCGTIEKAYHTTDKPNVFAGWQTLMGSNDTLNLISKLEAKIQGSNFNPGQFMGELPATLDLIGTNALRIAKSVSMLRRGRIADAFKAVSGHSFHKRLPPARRTMARNVIEVQYGWRPLLQDMQDGAYWVAAALQQPCTFRFCVRSRKTRQIPNTYGNTGGLQFRNTWQDEQLQLVAYLSENANRPSLTLWDVASAGYELMPWSFLVDWAIPIGTYLSARGTASKLSGKFVLTRQRNEHHDGVVMSPYGSVQYTKTYKYVAGPSSLWHYLREWRTVSSSLTPMVSLPDFKGLGSILSWEHCVNALGLLFNSKSRDPIDVYRDASRMVREYGYTE